jgi:ABC-type multidrug transport system ATPase subunit
VIKNKNRNYCVRIEVLSQNYSLRLNSTITKPMSLEVVNLSKIFGEQRAVDNISFIAPSGQITGFLGPNGAGKSTTMKIATGFSLATSGSVMVDEVDVNKDK